MTSGRSSAHRKSCDIIERKQEQINLFEAEHRTTKYLMTIVQATIQLIQGDTSADLKTAIEERRRALALGGH
jgi:hypothetical protein